jgi:hypothetical protein
MSFHQYFFSEQTVCYCWGDAHTGVQDFLNMSFKRQLLFHLRQLMMSIVLANIFCDFLMINMLALSLV